MLTSRMEKLLNDVAKNNLDGTNYKITAVKGFNDFQPEFIITNGTDYVKHSSIHILEHANISWKMDVEWGDDGFVKSMNIPEDFLDIKDEEVAFVNIPDEDGANELAHFGVQGMRWGVRKDRGSDGSSSAHQKANAKEEKSLNRAEKKAKSLANKKYLKVYNAMADESAEFYSKINNKPEYKGKIKIDDRNNPLTKKYLGECAKAATESLQRNSDRILGNKIDYRLEVKWNMPYAGGMPTFYVERVGDEIKHSEDISDDKIKLSVKFNGLGQIEKISLPSGSEKYFISDEGEED